MEDHQKPSIGRTVHYVSFGTPGGEYTSQCRAAIVTEVGAWVTIQTLVMPDTPDWTRWPLAIREKILGSRARELRQYYDNTACALMVANPTGQFFNTCIPYDPGTENDHNEVQYKGGTWHWPERV